MIIAYRHKFILHRERNGAYSVRLRVRLYSQKPIDVAAGVMLSDRALWDDERQRAKGKDTLSLDINRQLQRIEKAFLDLFERYEYINKAAPTIEQLRHDLAALVGRNNQANDDVFAKNDLFDVLERYCNEQGALNQWTKLTYRRMNTIRNHLAGYSTTIQVSSVTEDWMQQFVDYLISQGLNNTYISKQVALLRGVLRWAANHDLYSGNVHEVYKPKLRGSHFEIKEVIYLTLDELKTIEEYSFTDKQTTLERVRDVFVFCCYTGIRYSDVAKLSKNDIYNDHIKVITKKTNDRLRIELNKHSRAILQKYKDTEGDKALPTVSNQRSNVLLKKIGEMCGINEMVRIVYYNGRKRIEEVHPKWELLSTHCARRTFVVTALQLGIPAEVIMKWTGHSDFKAMQPYVKIVDDLKARNMMKFDEPFR